MARATGLVGPLMQQRRAPVAAAVLRCSAEEANPDARSL